jgi:hypothetical protein
MVKFIESNKIEGILIIIFVVAIGLNVVDLTYEIIGRYSLLILLLIYLLRMLISFRQWKFSRGISVINAYLNFQISSSVMAIGYIFLSYPGYGILTYNSITGPQTFLIIIGIFLVIRWRKIDKQVYWVFLKWNVIRAFTGVIICLLLFYALDIPTQFTTYPPPNSGAGLFHLPKRIF